MLCKVTLKHCCGACRVTLKLVSLRRSFSTKNTRPGEGAWADAIPLIDGHWAPTDGSLVVTDAGTPPACPQHSLAACTKTSTVLLINVLDTL